MEKKIGSKRSAKIRISAQEKSSLKSLLSPLEEAVLYGNSNPFVYKLGDTGVYISRYTAAELLHCISRKIELVKAARKKDELAKNIPLKHRETFDDPKIVLSLHPLLRNRLCKLECYSLYAIMLKGRTYFMKEQNFSKKNMQILDGLFAKYKCGDLF